MATLNFGTGPAINMNVGDLVRFGTEADTLVDWSWITPEGTDIDIDGTGITLDSNGHATGGTVNTIAIDVGDDSFLQPNIEITGLNVDAATLDDTPEAFWRTVLSGNDVINGPTVAKTGTGTTQLFGDGTLLPSGPNDAGDDFMTLGDASIVAVGDVTQVGSNAGFTGLNGGNDQMFVGASTLLQSIYGDARDVFGGGSLFAGDDLIEVRAANVNSEVAGDAAFAVGITGQHAFVEGGDDSISGLADSVARLIGDVDLQGSFSAIQGGNDQIDGSEQGETIIGDVDEIAGATVQTLTGGSDELEGKGGDDDIVGDVFSAVKDARFSGGDDIIKGGSGSDDIFGDLFGVDAEVIFPDFDDGDDQLFGDAGEDTLFGQTGNDTIDGGTGADLLDGGSGDDSLKGGSGKDTMVGGLGVDTVNYTAATGSVVVSLSGRNFVDSKIGGIAEDTISSVENILGSANNDTLTGDGAANFLFGGGGADTLKGGLAKDTMNGGFGKDTVDYRAAGVSVVLTLDGATDVTSKIGGVVADTLRNVESVLGGSAGDTLTGDGLANVFDGGLGGDRLSGKAGVDSLIGGAGNDTFVFGKGFDSDTVQDFANGSDKLDLRGFDFDSFAEVKALAVDTAAGDLRLTFGDGDVLTLADFTKAGFDAADVLI